MILSYSNVTGSFGEKHILKQVPLHLEEYEKVTVVGISGAGKSTLLKIIIGELPVDQGVAALDKGTSVGCLAQHQDPDSESTTYDALLEIKCPIVQMEKRIHSLELEMKPVTGDVLESMLSGYSRLNHSFELADNYVYRSEITDILEGLGFEEEEFTKHINTLSGGQETRVSLGKPLLTEPDILLLGEPTSHLGIESVAQLGTYLKGYSGNVIIVAHDRYFPDRVVAGIVEPDNGTATVSLGDYLAYSDKKVMLRDARIRAYLNQQQGIKHREEVITKFRSFNREKSVRRAESREKMLGRIKRLEKPADIDDSMDIRLEPDVTSGNNVLSVTNLNKSFSSQTLFSDVDFEVKRGEWAAIINNNGTGRTTLLRTTNSLLGADNGEIHLGSKTHVGYYDQERQVLHMGKTLFEEIQDTYPNMSNTQIRNTLVSPLSVGDDVFKLIKDLSDGEQRHISPAKLMLSDTNPLLLDEPTNHLDTTSKEILESALCRYTGAMLYMSHGRYSISRAATRILDLTNRFLINYIGNYDYYLEKKEDVEAAFAARSPSPTSPSKEGPKATPFAGPPASDVKIDWKVQEEEQARIRKRQNELKKAEDLIHALETRGGEIDGLLVQEEVYTDVARLMELNKEKEKIASRLEELYQRREELAED